MNITNGFCASASPKFISGGASNQFNNASGFWNFTTVGVPLNSNLSLGMKL